MAQQIKIPKKLFDELAEIARNPETYKEDLARIVRNLDKDISEYIYVVCENCKAMTQLQKLRDEYNFICPECKAHIKHLNI